MFRIHLLLSVALSAALSLMLTACSPVSKPPALVQPSGTQPAVTPIRADQLMPRSDTSGAFKVMVGPNKGEIRSFTRTFKDNHWVIFEKGDHRGFYHEDKQGRIILDREDDLTQNVRVEYEPGIVILPPVVGHGGPLPQGKVKMTVLNLTTGNLRDKGSCSYQVTGVTEKKLTTPLGIFTGYLIEQKRHLDLSLAQVDLTIHTGYVPGKGTVIDELWQTMQAMGGLITTHDHNLVERAK